MAYYLRVTWLGFVMFSLIGLSLQQNAALRLEVKPRYTQVNKDVPVTLTCTLSDGAGGRVPLAGCGFKHYESGAAWDIGTGSATIKHTIRGGETSALITSNPENDVGICSLKISRLQWGTFIVGCRLKPVSGGAWKYAAMMVSVDGYAPQQYSMQPSGVLVSLPGKDVSITVLAEHRIDRCGFELQPSNTGIVLFSGDTSKNTTEYRAWYEGRASRCGVTLLGVQPSRSGFVRSRVWRDEPRRHSADFVELIVATPPVSPPRLSVKTAGASFHAGDMLHATCVVGESRPVSNITWLLGGVVVRADDLNEAPADPTWRWNHEPQTIIQQLSRRVSQQDNGKELKCRAGHMALRTGTLDSNSHVIRVGAKSSAGA